MSNWVVVGISGVTNGGKGTLTKKLMNMLPNSTRLICQDDYFYPEDHPNHVTCPGILNHHNWEVISSLDMEKMKKDIKSLIDATPQSYSASPLSLNANYESSNCSELFRPILLLDGFIMYEDIDIVNMCDLQYFFTLTKDQCWERRKNRVYEPPDPSGYFEDCVWPMYEVHLKYVQNNVNVTYLDGMVDKCDFVYKQIMEITKK